MNYNKIYDNIISRAKHKIYTDEQYVESHHIIPRFMGGQDIPENYVKLTIREHFLCHLLLTKIVPKDKQYAAVKSVYMMLSWSYSNEKRISAIGGLSKKIIRLKMPPMPESTKIKISNSVKETFSNADVKARHLASVKARYEKPEEHKKLSDAQKLRFEKPEEHRKISESLKQYNKEHGSPNKGRSYAHLTSEQLKELFGSKNRGRIQTQEEKDRRAESIREHFRKKRELNIDNTNKNLIEF